MAVRPMQWSKLFVFSHIEIKETLQVEEVLDKGVKEKKKMAEEILELREIDWWNGKDHNNKELLGEKQNKGEKEIGLCLH